MTTVDAVPARDAGFFQRLREAGFRGDILTGPAVRVVYSTDNSIYQVIPRGVVVPRSAEDVAILCTANASQAHPAHLVARGGGTGTNGQSLGDDVVVDMRRGLNRILDVDLAAAEATVEPGVVLDQLNARVGRHGLHFAPHVSTASRATIGGMVATDAAGKGSWVHGRTNDHVVSVDTVLADGTPWTFGTVDAHAFDELCARDDVIGRVHRGIRQVLDGFDGSALPYVSRGFTGYNLGGVRRPDGSYDLAKLICGSEGTLAFVTRIRVRLTRRPSEVSLALLTYPDFESALLDAERLKDTRPIAIECLDGHTMELAADSSAHQTVVDLVGDVSGGILIAEYEGAPRDSMLDGRVGATGVAITDDTDTMAAIWRLRADAVGFLARPVGTRRSVAFVEDSAVPPDALAAFARDYAELLAGHGLTFGMFGHADVGCLHVRPALDLLDPADETMVRTISDAVAELVRRHGGVLWGEHGRGFRGEYLAFDDDTLRRMQGLKAAFDPADTLNPGKLYRPAASADAIIRIDEVPLRAHHDRTVASSDRTAFASAFACNGNAICHHWSDAAVMCPSYKATNDPTMSPKGRADLVRAWLREPSDELAVEVARSMHACLSCSACTGTCPVGVDIPELKSRFLERHGEPDRRRRIRNLVLGRLEPALPSLSRAARVVGPVQRLVGSAVLRRLGIVDLPIVPPSVQARTGRVTQVAEASVIVLPDAFTAHLDPSVLRATLRLLAALGERPAVGPFTPSGKFDHVMGRRSRFAAAARRRRRMVEEMAAHGVPLVVLEPAVSQLERHEYPAVVDGYPDHLVTPIASLLADRLEQLPDVVTPIDGSVTLFGHCSEMSLTPDHYDTYRELLERCGASVTVPATTCCGMAGIFGHEAEHVAMSTALFDSSWRPHLEGSSLACAPGYSCRSQVRRMRGTRIPHPIELAVDSLGL